MAQWEFEKPYFSGDEFFKSVIEAIRSAKKSIDLETYIFARDAFSRRIETELIDAIRRGIAVRILVDGIGALGWIDRWNEQIPKLGGQIRVFHPVRFSILQAGRVLLRINQRDHRKIWIFDEQLAGVGSMNISSDHLVEFRGDLAWRDTALMVKGGEVRVLTQAFNRTWDKSEPYPPKRNWRRVFTLRRRLPKNSIVRLNDSRSLRKWSTKDLRKRIRLAKNRVWITNPYFAPSPFFLSSLIRAKEYQADVKLLVPTVSDVFFMKWVAHSYYGSLLKAGIEVYEYQPRFLHAKSVIIDNWATIGTSNLNTRSFRHDLEVDLVVTQESTLKMLENQFLEDLKQSQRIELRHWKKNQWINRLGRLISYLFGRWI